MDKMNEKKAKELKGELVKKAVSCMGMRREQDMQMMEQVVRMFASKFGDAGDSDAVINKKVDLALSYATEMKSSGALFEDILDQLFFMVDESDDLADVKKNVATAKAYVIEIDKQMREESVTFLRPASFSALSSIAGEIVKKAEAIREVQNLRKNMTVDNPRLMEIVKQERELIKDIECLNEMLFGNLSGANIIRSAIAILEGKAPVKAPVKEHDEHKGGRSFPCRMETVKAPAKAPVPYKAETILVMKKNKAPAKKDVCQKCPGGFRTPVKAPVKKVKKPVKEEFFQKSPGGFKTLLTPVKKAVKKQPRDKKGKFGSKSK